MIKNKTEIDIDNQSREIAYILALLGIVLYFIYEDMNLPKSLWFISHLYNLFELLKKHIEDKSKKGVVGNTGKIIPSIPRNRDVDPKEIRTIFLI